MKNLNSDPVSWARKTIGNSYFYYTLITIHLLTGLIPLYLWITVGDDKGLTIFAAVAMTPAIYLMGIRRLYYKIVEMAAYIEQNKIN